MRSACLTGRLGRDPKVRAVGEYSVLDFSIANDDESKKNQAGEYEKQTSWFDITFWTKNPQHWINQLYKGALVAVECDVKQDRWEHEGQTRSKIKFVVRRGCFPIVMSKTGGEHAPSPEGPASFPDDIPF
jgi:single-strand DNA-binding protein